MIMSDTLSLTLLGIVAVAICVAFQLEDLPDSKKSGKMFLLAFMLLFLALVVDLFIAYLAVNAGILSFARDLFASAYGLTMLIAFSWRYRPEAGINWYYPLAIGYLLIEIFIERNYGQTLYYWAITHALCGLIVLARPEGRNTADNLLVLALALLALIKVDIVSTIMAEQDMNRLYGGISFIADNHAILMPGAFAAVLVFLVTSYLQDATERHEFLSNKDRLTGLLSRAALYEQAEVVIAMSNRIGKPSSVLVSSITNTKEIETTFGLETLEKTLTAYTQMLQNHLRAEDLVARWGDDEFVIVLPKTDLQQAELLVSRFKEKARMIRVTTDKGDITIIAENGVASIEDKSNLDDAKANATKSIEHTLSE